MTRLESGDALSRMRDAVLRAGGRIADHTLDEDARQAIFNIALPDHRFERFRDALPELAIYVDRADQPDRPSGKRLRCMIALAFEDG